MFIPPSGKNCLKLGTKACCGRAVGGEAIACRSSKPNKIQFARVERMWNSLQTDILWAETRELQANTP